MSEARLSEVLMNGSPADRAKVMADLMIAKRYPIDCVAIAKRLVDDESTVAFGTPVGWVAAAFLDLAGEIPYSGNNEVVLGLIEANK